MVAVLLLSPLLFFTVVVRGDDSAAFYPSTGKKESDFGALHYYHQHEDAGADQLTYEQQQQSYIDNLPPDEFYQWSLDDTSLVAALFPNLPWLRAAWEVHPLLSKVSFNIHTDTMPQPLNSIPTLFHNRSSTLQYGNSVGGDPILSLFSVSDTTKLLSAQHKDMTSPTDYRIVKRSIDSEGEELTDILPNSRNTVDEIIHFLYDKEMSLILYQFQKRDPRVAKAVRQLEYELGPKLMNANLYLTPKAKGDDGALNASKRRQGLSAHWDDRDVIVVQLAGKKRWSVASEPTMYLTTRDNRRKPTKDEIRHYAQDNQFLEFTMCPGDVLYIPRGHLHNASTVEFDNLNRKWKDWDDCPDYPANLPEAAPLIKALHEPSMHLTFSLISDDTLEMLISYASTFYFNTQRGHMVNKVVIPAGSCPSLSPGQQAVSHDVTMMLVLKYVVGEVARRPTACDAPSYRGVPSKHRRECGSATLRRLIPFSLLDRNNELQDTKDLSTEKYIDIKILKKEYDKALDIISKSASIPKTVGMLNKLNNMTVAEGRHQIKCPEALLNAISSDEFLEVVEDFVAFAKEQSVFIQAYKSMHAQGKKMRDHHDRDGKRWLL